MISKAEVEHVAKLARIGISEEEKEKFSKELSLILDYIKQLEKLDVSKIEPTSHITGAQNVMREDRVFEIGQPEEKAIKKEEKEEVARKLVEMAPDRDKGWIKVKSVL